MAQQNTGLGWEADAEWLMSAAGQVAAFSVFGGAAYPDQPIPQSNASQTPTAAEAYAAGLKVGESGNNDLYIYAGTGTPVLAGGADSGQSIVLIAQTSGIRVRWAWVNRNTGVVARTDYEVINSFDNTTGLYYKYQTAFYWYIDNPSLPQFGTLRNALDSVDISNVPINKLNVGAAVACVAQWYTVAGTELISPVLISSNPASTILTTDGTTPAAGMTTFDFLLDGMRFYMSLIGGNSDPVTTALEYADLRQFAAALPQKVFTLLASDSFSNIVVLSSPDPYGEEGGASSEEGGDGDSEPEDEPVEEETLPIPAVSGLGFSTIYVPTAYDLYQLASYLWSGNLDLDNFLRLFANPMDSILGLSAVPVALSGTYEPIYLGGQLLQGVTMPRYSGRTAVKVDMGSVTISKRWGSYLDYDPYTEFAVYLPFIGIKNIKADDVMEKTVSLMYNIDILSGACVAYLRTSGGSVLYEWAGQCAMQIPITGSNWDNIFSTAISTAVTLGGAMVAPASAPMLAGSVASAAVQAVAAKPRVERSGAVTGVTGFLGQLRPYIIRTIPEAYIPNDQNKFIGYPSYISANLGSLTGYNEVASIHLENIPATGDELSELESILKGGVIF